MARTVTMTTYYPAPNGEYEELNVIGNVGIGTTAPIYKLEVAGSSANNTGSWITRSDFRLKRDIVPLTNALDVVTALQGVSFHWKDEEKDNQYGKVHGFIAQDVERVMPQWVMDGPDGYKSLEMIGLNAFLIEAIKELQVSASAEIAARKSENDMIKSELCRKDPGYSWCVGEAK